MNIIAICQSPTWFNHMSSQEQVDVLNEIMGRQEPHYWRVSD
jgi:hypothetical protein